MLATDGAAPCLTTEVALSRAASHPDATKASASAAKTTT